MDWALFSSIEGATDVQRDAASPIVAPLQGTPQGLLVGRAHQQTLHQEAWNRAEQRTSPFGLEEHEQCQDEVLEDLFGGVRLPFFGWFVPSPEIHF